MSLFENILNDNDINQNINEDELPGTPGSDDEENKMNDEGIKVEPKKRNIRNPRIRLTVDTLKGSRGIHKIENHFKNIKFNGKGHEKTDLNEILRRMQHWAHRMYPNFKFDDVISNIDRLSKKKILQVHMNRYRLDQLEPDLPENSDLTANANLNDIISEVQDEPFDEFDALLGEQIAYSKLTAKTNESTNIENNMSVSTSIYQNPKLNIGNAIRSTSMTSDFNSKPTLTSEQLAKIAENRRIAQEKLKAKKELLSVQN